MIYEVIDVPQKEPCENCNPCMRMRLLEMGFVFGTEISVVEKQSGMFVIDMISPNRSVEQTIALRKEELDRVCYKLK
jgi:Fe2+ transport system protein FeoA